MFGKVQVGKIPGLSRTLMPFSSEIFVTLFVKMTVSKILQKNTPTSWKIYSIFLTTFRPSTSLDFSAFITSVTG